MRLVASATLRSRSSRCMRAALASSTESFCRFRFCRASEGIEDEAVAGDSSLVSACCSNQLVQAAQCCFLSTPAPRICIAVMDDSARLRNTGGRRW